MRYAIHLKKALLQAAVLGATMTTPFTVMAGGAAVAAETPIAGLTWVNVPTQMISAAVLDNWNPRVVDDIAAKHHVIVFDNRGVGASGGSPPGTIEEMAEDAIAFIKAMCFEQVDLLDFSMGGMVSQEIILRNPGLVRNLILTDTGPAGAAGIGTVAGVSNVDIVRELITSQDPKQFQLFTRSPDGISVSAYLAQRSPNSTHVIYPDAGHGGI